MAPEYQSNACSNARKSPMAPLTTKNQSKSGTGLRICRAWSRQIVLFATLQRVFGLSCEACNEASEAKGCDDGEANDRSCMMLSF